MRFLTRIGIVLAVMPLTFSGAWADCTYNEAEDLNAKITSKAITDLSADNWPAEYGQRLQEIKNQFNNASDQHNVAVSADDQNGLNAVCDSYRAILAEIDELTKQLE